MNPMTVIVSHTNGDETTYEGVVKLPWTWRNMLVLDLGGPELTYVPLALVADFRMARPEVVPA